MSTMTPTLEPGQRIRFRGEKQAYTVRVTSTDGRYAILTKPFNVKRTVLYSVIDFHEGVRGRDNYYHGLGYETDEACAAAMQMFESGDAEVSLRSWIWLRYADTQPDHRTHKMLDELRDYQAERMAAREYPRRNSMLVVSWDSLTEAEA